MATPPNAAQLAREQVAAATQIARFSEPEFWFSVSPAIAAAGGITQINPPSPVNLTRPVQSLTIQIAMRVTVAVAPYTAVAPEAPQNFLQLIQLQGNHKDYGGITPTRMTGATMMTLGQISQPNCGGGETLISVGGGALTRFNGFGRPFVSPFTGAVGTHDMLVMFHVPFGPSLMPSPVKYRQSTNFLLQPLDWGNTLQLQLQLGDASALGDPTGATVTFQGFGGAGNPLVSVFANYALLGEFQNKMQRSGVVIRNEQQLPNQVAAANAVLLQQLSHQITSLMLLKTGNIQAAGLTAGVDTLAALSDVQLEATQIVVDNKPLRNNTNNMMEKSYHQRMFDTVVPEGYFPLTFVDGGTSLLAYRGDKLPGGSQFNLQTNVLTAAATQRQRMVQEYILGGPFPA